MDDRYINLKELLPLYLQEYKEIAEIMDTETPEFRLLESKHNRMIDNRYIISCDVDGITRFEKILHVMQKSDDTLEDRIFRCLAKWNACLPYNYAFLEKKLNELCGTEYEINFNIPEQTMIVKIGITQKNQYDSVVDILDEIVPCNILLSAELLYNQYKTLRPYPHKILGQFTYWELRNISIPKNLSTETENIAAYTVEELSRFTAGQIAEIGLRKREK